MLLGLRFLYKRLFILFSEFTTHWWTWTESFQYMYGNIFIGKPVGFNKKRSSKYHHPFHILKPSPWPFCMSLSLLALVGGLVDFLMVEEFWGYSLFFALFQVLVCMWAWWRDVVEESLTEHTKEIKYGIAVGMVLFIISEVMFFFSFFWAFFHVSLAPGIELGCVWPPKGLEDLVISPFGAPLLNTVVLLASGVTLTCAHHAFMATLCDQRRLSNFLNMLGILGVLKGVCFGYSLHVIGGKEWWWFKSKNFSNMMTVFLEQFFNCFKQVLFNNLFVPVLAGSYAWYCVRYFIYTLILAVFFTFSQGIEYLESAICISDGVYGSTFFVMTGFHGFHVIVGTIFLIVCFIRILFHKYSVVKFIGLECAIWYWHFVDVVWLFLFIFVYYWGNAFVPILDLGMFDFAYIEADFSEKLQCDFQDSASVLMESIVDLHNYIMFYLFVVLGIVAWMLIAFSFFNPGSALQNWMNFIELMVLDLKTRETLIRRAYFTENEKMLRKKHEIIFKVHKSIDRKLKKTLHKLVNLLRKY